MLGRPNDEHLENIVVIPTTPNSTSARAITNEPVFKSGRCVRRPLNGEIELAQSFNLDENEDLEYDELGHRARETGDACTAGDEEGSLWGIESYL